MKCKIMNKTGQDMTHIMDFLKGYLPYAQRRMKFNKPVDIELASDRHNADALLGKTAYYDPDTQKVCVFVDKRHPKDILRSITHELMHHAQYCRGDFDNLGGHMGDGYAQKNNHLRNMEKEAYNASIIFRDYEDMLKSKQDLQEIKDTNVWKSGVLFETLTNKWARGEEVEVLEESIQENGSNVHEKRKAILERLKNA